MARKKRKSDPGVIEPESKEKWGEGQYQRLGLANPYPSSPGKPGRHCLYVYRKSESQPNDRPQFHSCYIWATNYAMRKFIDAILEGYKWSRVGDHKIETDDGRIILKLDAMDEVMKYKLNDKEQRWIIPIPDAAHITQIRDNIFIDYRDREKIAAMKEAIAEGKVVTTSMSAKPEKAKREPKEKREPRPSKEGLVTVGDIAAALKIDAKDARRALRASGEAKPDAGWAWDPKEKDRITKLIKKHLKE